MWTAHPVVALDRRDPQAPSPQPAPLLRGYLFSSALVALALTGPGLALADVVYGTIKVNGVLLASGEVVVHVGDQPVPVQTDSDGRYRVVLQEGIYTVEYRGKHGEIRSYSQPVNQDIDLK